MNTRDTTLQEFLFPQGGVPDQVWTKVLRNPAVIPVLAGFAVNIVDGVKAQIKDSIGTLFQMSLLDVLVGGWKKYADVSQALEKSKQTPNDTVLESMANHTFKSVHHPYIALYRADVQVAKIEFETTVSLNVEAVQLRIRNGEITGILTGACQGTITLALAGQVLSEAQTGKIALPGSVAIKPAAAQADSAGAVPEEPAARVQVEKVQATPAADPGAQKQAAQNPFIKPLPELTKPSGQKPPPPPPPAAPPPAKPPRKSNNAVLVIGIIVVLCICISAAAFILVIARPSLIAQVNPTKPPVVATVPVLPPPTSAPVPSAPTVPPALPTTAPAAPPTTAPAAPPTTAPAAPPTTAPAAPPTTAPAAPPTTAPAAPPTAAPAATSTTAPAAPTLPPPGLYVTSMGMDQAQPMHGQLVNFTVSFLNTTGGDQGVKWRVYIYRADTPTRTNTDSAPVQVTLHPGPTLDQAVPMNFKYGSSGNVCDYFYARVDTVDNSNNPTGEMTATDGKVFQKDFTVCN